MIDILYLSETSNQHDLRFETRWRELGKSTARLDSSQFRSSDLSTEISRALEFYSPRLVQVGPLPKLSNLVLDAWFGPTLAVSWGFDLLGSRLDDDSEYKKSVLRTLRESSALLVDSKASLRVVERLGANLERVYFLPWGVEEIFLHRAMKAPPTATNPKEEVTFITTRNHEPIYNVRTVVKSFLLAGVSGSRLLVAGSGSETQDLRTIADEYSNPGVSVEFLGRVSANEMMEALSRSNFYISAASVDGSSVSLLEAMALGVVPVVPNLPGNREWVNPSVGHMFDLNAGTLAELIKVLAAKVNTDAHHSMSLRASGIIHERADWTENSSLLSSIYENLVIDCSR